VIFAEHVPERTAEAVRRLEAAGYANVGKTNLHEFAYGISSQNPHFGTVPGRVSGAASLVSTRSNGAWVTDIPTPCYAGTRKWLSFAGDFMQSDIKGTAPPHPARADQMRK